MRPWPLSTIPDEPHQNCGISYEHQPNGGATECLWCGADLSSWVDDEDDQETETS